MDERENLHYRMMRDGGAAMSLKSYYRIGRALDITAKRIKKKKSKKGIRADRPFEILHVDVTSIRLADGTRVFIQFITDNFSRAILGAKALLEMERGDDGRKSESSLPGLRTLLQAVSTIL